MSTQTNYIPQNHLYRTLTRRNVLLLLFSALMFSGCASTPSATPAQCSLDSPGSMATLSTTARKELAKPECRGQFMAYFALAMARAESAPDEANRARFAELINDGARHGHLTEHEARRLYTRHFHTTFISLPADYNLCSTLRRKEPLFAALAAELEDKRRGMLMISSDRAGFAEAQRQYADLMLVFEATALACVDG